MPDTIAQKIYLGYGNTLNIDGAPSVNLTPIGYVPSATGNVNNLNSYVTDPNGDTWFIDQNGNAVLFASSSSGFTLYETVSGNVWALSSAASLNISKTSGLITVEVPNGAYLFAISINGTSADTVTESSLKNLYFLAKYSLEGDINQNMATMRPPVPLYGNNVPPTLLNSGVISRSFRVPLNQAAATKFFVTKSAYESNFAQLEVLCENISDSNFHITLLFPR